MDLLTTYEVFAGGAPATLAARDFTAPMIRNADNCGNQKNDTSTHSRMQATTTAF